MEEYKEMYLLGLITMCYNITVNLIAVLEHFWKDSICRQVNFTFKENYYFRLCPLNPHSGA